MLVGLFAMLPFAGHAQGADPTMPGLVPDTLKVAADGTDDAPSIGRAVAQACAGAGTELRLRARVYMLASPIVQSCAVHWIGQGWQEPSGGTGTASPGRGTWLQVAGTGFTPVTVSGGGASGSVFEGFGVYQAQPAPGPGWAPSAYPYVFDVSGTGGEVTFRHLMLLAVNKGITAYAAGRLKIEDLRGQVFSNALIADKSYDTTIIDDVHLWPYWSQATPVVAWQQANMDALVLGRVDDIFIGRVFAFGARSVVKLVTTQADPANPSVLPGGSATNAHIGTVRSDFTRWTLWNTAVPSYFEDVSVSVDALIHQGQTWGDPVPLSGSAAIRNEGAFRLWSVGYLKADFLDTALVDASVATAPSAVQVGRGMVTFAHPARGACALLAAGGRASTLEFALPPVVNAGQCAVVPRLPARADLAPR